MFENVLFPVDFSPACLGMAAYVKRVAALFNSRVTLLHVCDLNSQNGFELYLRTLQEIAEEHWAVASQKLDSFLQSEFPPTECNRLLRSGDPSIEIVDVAHSGRFDLIVMPTHAGRFRQIFLGSTTAKVLDDADCPVMTTEHADTLEPSPLEHRHWVCALDFVPESAGVLGLATRAAEEVHAQLTVIHVEDGKASKPVPEYLADADIQVATGHVKEELLKAAQRPAADALIIGRSRKHGVFGRMRDLSFGLIRDSPVPVLSV